MSLSYLDYNGLSYYNSKIKEYIDSNGKIKEIGVRTVSDGAYTNVSIVDGQARIDLSDYARKSDVASALKYKGSVASFSNLPTSPSIGDLYTVEDENVNYAWDGEKWNKMGSGIDISNYYTKGEVNNLLSNYAEKSSIPVQGMIEDGNTGYITGGQIYSSVPTVAITSNTIDGLFV